MATEHPEVPRASDLVAQHASQIAGKTVFVTGVTPGGLGATFVEAIGKASPGLVILAGRAASTEATAATLREKFPSVATRTVELDLGSQASVRRAAGEVNGWVDVQGIDALVLNGGIMGVAFGRTADGLERQFGVNHVGHFLLAGLLMDKVLRGRSSGPDGAGRPGGRVVCVSSDGYRLDAVRFDNLDFDGGQAYDPWRAYGQSKTANMLHAVALAERLGDRGVTALSLHPGVIRTTGLSRGVEDGFKGLVKLDTEQGNRQAKDGFKVVDPDQGVATHVFAAFAPKAAAVNGAYCIEARVCAPDEVRAWARDKVEAERLWKLTEELVGEKFAWS